MIVAPTELQCLARRMHNVAQELVRMLPSTHAAWVIDATRDDASAHDEGADRTVSVLMGMARALEFDAARAVALANTQADTDRVIFDTTVSMVDLCRMARSTSLSAAGVERDAPAVALADDVEEHLADVQECLRERFPGDAGVDF